MIATVMTAAVRRISAMGGIVIFAATPPQAAVMVALAFLTLVFEVGLDGHCHRQGFVSSSSLD
jgi:hypothetical protein